MKVIDVAPKDIHILVDFSLKELLSLKLILDNMSFDFDGTKESHINAKDFLEGDFYHVINSTIKELVNGT